MLWKARLNNEYVIQNSTLAVKLVWKLSSLLTYKYVYWMHVCVKYLRFLVHDFNFYIRQSK